MRTDIQESSLGLIRQWAGNATDALLDPQSKHFYLPDCQGLIGYREHDGCIVAYGDPVCPPDKVPVLVEGFHQDCLRKHKSYIFLPATQEFALWYFENYGGAVLEFGAILTLDPHQDPRRKQGVNASLVRRKARRAEKENVKIHEYLPSNPELEKKIEVANQAWTQNRKGPQAHISHHRLFNNREGKRWFYAAVQDEVVGSLTLNRLERYSGWLLNHLTFIPNAPGGTQELLVLNTIDQLNKENCHFVTFGASPAQEIRDFAGLGRLYAAFIQSAYKITGKLLHLEGHRKFWEKFDPESQPAYLVFSNNHIGYAEVRAILNAMNISLF
jgi:lysylphosphatidylglycerol synthetase-like protein (DUF2156 family)